MARQGTPNCWLPQSAHRVSTYERLEEYVTAFASGHLNLLILVGAAGLAKSRTVRQVLGDGVCWIEGNATPFGMYVKLFRNRNKFVVIDDVDSLYSDRSGVRLLKCLCQTEPQKAVAWHSAARALEREGVAKEFQTTSRVVIVTNDWRTLNRNVAAIEDRGHVLAFEPTAEEVHRKVGSWFEDQEILTWFERQLPRIRAPSMRLYIQASELKRAGMDWRAATPMSKESLRARLVAELKADSTFRTEEARAQEFRVRGGGCRATYFNYARKVIGT